MLTDCQKIQIEFQMKTLNNEKSASTVGFRKFLTENEFAPSWISLVKRPIQWPIKFKEICFDLTELTFAQLTSQFTQLLVKHPPSRCKQKMDNFDSNFDFWRPIFNVGHNNLFKNFTNIKIKACKTETPFRTSGR